ncbi:MAG: VanZ family protein [Gammaproteobacteria bacterium]|nr:VanZ family protein [Gammaproteobacteria bacterium]MBQ0839484.1 VanZ family protein [Gammaproteobacteria bacterium]
MEHVLEKPLYKIARVGLVFLLFSVAWACLQAPGPDDTPWFIGADKIIHLSTYALLYICAWLAFPGAFLSWTLHGSLLAYGLMIEGLQSLTSYRSAELADMLANATGLGLGCLLLSLVAGRLVFIHQYRAAYVRLTS